MILIANQMKLFTKQMRKLGLEIGMKIRIRNKYDKLTLEANVKKYKYSIHFFF